MDTYGLSLSQADCDNVTWEGTVWEAPLPWRIHLPSESEVTKDGGRFDQDSYEKGQEAHQGIAVSYWDIIVNSSG